MTVQQPQQQWEQQQARPLTPKHLEYVGIWAKLNKWNACMAAAAWDAADQCSRLIISSVAWAAGEQSQGDSSLAPAVPPSQHHQLAGGTV